MAHASPNNTPLSKDPYRGVRDFYPEDMAVQNYIFDIMRRGAESFGYLEYGASLLEPVELYEAKSGEEIANEQTYQFTDRGGRRVALRPEMTPTLARLVAKRRSEMPLPIRLYSVPNVFRYERPQRGRLREHWQLNVDIFGVDAPRAEAEIISVADAIMRAFGATAKDYEIRINSRALMSELFENLGIPSDTRRALMRLIDRKEKIEPEEFISSLTELLGERAEIVSSCVAADSFESYTSLLPAALREHESTRSIGGLLEQLAAFGIDIARFDPTITRGFDYYTGIVFEVFDTDPENRRSLFGGGRYDNLLEIFGEPPLSGVGFGMGDVTIRDFLITHDLMPAHTDPTHLFLCTAEPSYIPKAQEFAFSLRRSGVNVAVNLIDRTVAEQIQAADRRGIPYIVCIGGREEESRRYMLKHLASGAETLLSEDELIKHILATDS